MAVVNHERSLSLQVTSGDKSFLERPPLHDEARRAIYASGARMQQSPPINAPSTPRRDLYRYGDNVGRGTHLSRKNLVPVAEARHEYYP
jgi:hypothetical protein